MSGATTIKHKFFGLAKNTSAQDGCQEYAYVQYFEAMVANAATTQEIADPSTLQPGYELERTEPGANFPPKVIHARQRGRAVSRIKSVLLSAGNGYYIRLLLLSLPARGWRDLKLSPDGTAHSTHQQAAEHEGFTQANDEPRQILQAACDLHTSPTDLRFLLCIIIHDGANYLPLWDAFKDNFSRDFLSGDFLPLNYEPHNTPTVTLEQSRTSALQALNNILITFGLSTTVVGLPTVADTSNLGAEDAAYFASHQRQCRFVAKAISDNLRGHGHLLAVCGATVLSASAFQKRPPSINVSPSPF
ncbi:hypothetical protein V8E36_005378 [Tilletia maclaganii]